MRKILTFTFLTIILLSCTEPGKQTEQVAYFNLKSYFDSEGAKLNVLNPWVTKTVSINGSKETKRLKIKNFQSELEAFSAADINKDSWIGSFKVDSSENELIYTTTNKKIPVKTLNLRFDERQLVWLQIISRNENLLYQAVDTLTYVPGSFYEIKKFQQVSLMEKKYYLIKGLFQK